MTKTERGDILFGGVGIMVGSCGFTTINMARIYGHLPADWLLIVWISTFYLTIGWTILIHTMFQRNNSRSP